MRSDGNFGLLRRPVRVAIASFLFGISAVHAQQPSDTTASGSASLHGEGKESSKESAEDRGIKVNFIYTGDALANVSGGNRRGAVYQGKLEFALAADLEKLAGWAGLRFYTDAFQIHNTGRIRRDYVGGVNTIAAIEADPATRLSEIWLEQEFENGRGSVRVGQLAADVEFFFSGLSIMYLQSDWATIAAANMPSGGPAYPLSTPGIRLKLEPTREMSLLFAVFNGDPAGSGTGDEQKRNAHGLNFRTSDSALLMAEAQFRTHHGAADTGLARTLKLGGWSNRGNFDDQRFANDGTLLANPAGSGVAAQKHTNFGVYAVIDQQLYRPQGGGAESGISVFGRVSGARSDRNAINRFVDGGIVFAGMIPSRPHDKFGSSFMYSRYANSVRGFDLDQANFSGTPVVVQDYEANLELTYVAQLARGWTVQPVFTYVWHPNGDATRNAVVTGVRSIWQF